MRFTTLAPAKVNLLLRVGPRRADGYHEILSLVAPLDLADRVDVRIGRRAGGVTCSVPRRPDLDGPSNLAARAAQLFLRRFGLANAVAIRIEKRIPVTAGLGGGSSDAAATLRVLAHAFETSDGRALHEIALEVGSDVPLFLGAGPFWARGRGERLAKARIAPLHLVLVYPVDPAHGIRAAEAYGWLDEDRGGSVPALPKRVSRFRPSGLWNDLEAPCLARRPLLSSLRGSLVGQGATKAIMSGSGPTWFGAFPGRSSAARAAMAIEKEGLVPEVQVVVARTVQEQPRVTPWRSPRSASSPSTRRS